MKNPGTARREGCEASGLDHRGGIRFGSLALAADGSQAESRGDHGNRLSSTTCLNFQTSDRHSSAIARRQACLSPVKLRPQVDC